MDKKAINFIRLLFIVGILIFLIPVAFFVINFKDQKISSDSSDWATFSNYLNGLLTPFFSLINILVLMYLTFEIARRNKDQHIEALEHQKNIHREQLSNQKLIQLNELKYEAYKDFVKLSFAINTSMVDFDHPGIKLSIYRLEFLAMAQLNNKIFNTLADTMKINAMAVDISDLSKLIIQIFKTNDESDQPKAEACMKKVIDNFQTLLRDMQKELS